MTTATDSQTLCLDRKREQVAPRRHRSCLAIVGEKPGPAGDAGRRKFTFVVDRKSQSPQEGLNLPKGLVRRCTASASFLGRGGRRIILGNTDYVNPAACWNTR